MGGALAIASSVLVPEVNAVVAFYGVPSPELADPVNAKAPVQAHFGEDDAFVGFSDVKVHFLCASWLLYMDNLFSCHDHVAWLCWVILLFELLAHSAFLGPIWLVLLLCPILNEHFSICNYLWDIEGGLQLIVYFMKQCIDIDYSMLLRFFKVSRCTLVQPILSRMGVGSALDLFNLTWVL